MAFNWRDFATGALEQASEEMDVRSAEAKAYKQRQLDAADRNASLIQTRKARAQQAAAYGKQAMQIMKDVPNARNIVMTAMASGMGSVQELYEKLNKAAQMPGQNGKLGVDDVEAIISMPSIPGVDENAVGMSLQEFAERTYGAKLTKPAPKTEEAGLVASLFGFDDMNQAKRELEAEDYGSGMTVAEINALAKRSEYESLIPGATMTFRDLDSFGFEQKRDFTTSIVEAQDAALKANESVIEALDPEDRIAYRQQVRRGAAEREIRLQVDRYKNSGILEDRYALDQIEDTMGADFLDKLLIEYGATTQEELDKARAEAEAELNGGTGAEGGTGTEPAAEGGTGTEPAAEPAVTGGVTPRPEGTVDPLDLNAPIDSDAEQEWDRKYEGKYDPTTGDAIVVPKRPAKSETRDERKLSGRISKVSLYKEWMDKYGDTHDPETGLPLPVEE
jgi:hypothetical protein